MSGGYPTGLSICSGNDYGTSGAQGATVTSGAANTKGSWLQLTSSAAADISMLYICTNYYANSGNDQMAFDVGVGASGSEVAIVSNLMCDGCFSTGVGGQGSGDILIPISIPAGTRISARCQSSATAGSDQGSISVKGWDSAFSQVDGCSGVDAIGFQSASTKGTAVTCSTNNTKGSYSQITASTSRDYIGLFGAMDLQHSNINPGDMTWDIAIGASGSEKIIVPSYACWGAAAGGLYPPVMQFLPIQIPAGTRLAARVATKTAATVGLTLYGVYQ
jgi:hypothetical protein